MKRILFIIDRLNEGAGRVLYDIVKNIDRERFEPIVVSIYNNGNMVDRFSRMDVKVIFMNKRHGSGLDCIFKIRKIIRKERVDIIHTHNVDSYEYGVPAAWLSGIRNIIHTCHGKSVKTCGFKRFRENLAHKFISLFLDKYVVVSDDLGRYVSRNWCFNRKKIKTIYNGIDTAYYKKVSVHKKLLMKVDCKDEVVGIVAGLRPVKDHITLIKAMNIVCKEIPDSKLVIVGDGPEKSRLVNFVNETGLEKNVLFLGNKENVYELLNCFDVGVLSSLSECLSITLLEGMASEIPFIATNVGGNSEVIENNIDGFLVPARSSVLLAQMIIKVLKNGKLREKIGKKGREKVCQKFNVKDMVMDYEKMYLKIRDF